MTSRDQPPSRGPSKLFVVDGTGKSNETEYQRDMSNGFCKRLEKQCGATYWRGPTIPGNETIAISREVAAAVREWVFSPAGVAGRVFLAGHSRGGAAVIFAAQDLQKLGIHVEAMFLYDAVNRTFNTLRSPQTIPGNVRTCYHAMREPSLAHYYTEGAKAAREKVAVCLGMPTRFRSILNELELDRVMSNSSPSGNCEDLIQRARQLDEEDRRMKRCMRSVATVTPEGEWSGDFGNCGTEAEPPCTFPATQRVRFMGSHGAIGGAPIVDSGAPELLIQADRAAMASVGAWMGKNLAAHGLFQAH